MASWCFGFTSSSPSSAYVPIRALKTTAAGDNDIWSNDSRLELLWTGLLLQPLILLLTLVNNPLTPTLMEQEVQFMVIPLMLKSV